MSFASSSTATTEVVSNRFVLAGLGSFANVGRRDAAIERGARTSQIVNQVRCATNATPMPDAEDQIHGVAGNKKDGNTNRLSALR